MLFATAFLHHTPPSQRVSPASGRLSPFYRHVNIAAIRRRPRPNIDY